MLILSQCKQPTFKDLKNRSLSTSSDCSSGVSYKSTQSSNGHGIGSWISYQQYSSAIRKEADLNNNRNKAYYLTKTYVSFIKWII